MRHLLVTATWVLVPAVAAAQSGFPRTGWGTPDLRGLWNHGTATPLERPERHTGQEFLTDEEIADVNAAARSPEGVGARRAVWWERPLSDGRTSMIVSPSGGRIPYTAEADTRLSAMPPLGADHPEDRSASERCISYGIPRLGGPYSQNIHLVQTPDHIAIQHEMIHDVRIIPLSEQPYIDGEIRQWMGDARAYWQNDTLVVETKNFHNRGWIASSSAGARLKGIPTSKALYVVERYQRVAEDTIVWTVTVNDSNVYTRPWTISMPLTAEPDYEMFEYACHEGNYAVPNALSGQRVIDKREMSDNNE